MITAFQETKLRLFFDLLDFDGNGFIEQDDFQAIGENICLLADVDEEHPMYSQIFEAANQIWLELYKYVDRNKDQKASVYEWLRFADENIVNTTESNRDDHLNQVVKHLFILFDLNKDNFISLKEFLGLFMTFRLEARYSARAFCALDLNLDKMISKEELLLAVGEFFRSNNPEAKGNWLFGPVRTQME